MMFTLFLLVIMFIIVAMMWNEGMWSNAISFCNCIFAAMIATNYYEPLAGWLEEKVPSYTYFCDFLAIWLLFWLAASVLRAITDWISVHQVRFRLPVEMVGKGFFAVATAWVFVCFTCMTIHMAPLARTPFGGGFQQEPLSNHLLGLAPDRMWLAFMHTRSKGALAKSQPVPFDPDGEFVLKYGSRRHELEKLQEAKGTSRVAP